MRRRRLSQTSSLQQLCEDMNWELDPLARTEDIFEIVEEIGKGGFGSVYKVRHRQSGLCLAGKTINPDVLTGSASESIVREIELIKKITTAYTIQFYGNIIYNDEPMLLMEYCDRGSLRDILDFRGKTLTEQQAAFVIADLLTAVHILHTKYKILHRDIKAGNILLNSSGQIKVTDFGLSTEFSNGKFNTFTPMGTPYWMAPEVINGKPYSFPADVWSIAATAIELIEGGPPYYELEPTKAMLKIARSGFPGFRNPKAMSKEFKDFISHTMSRDPNNRCTIPQLLEHPWIQQITKLDRTITLAPIVDTVVDRKQLKEVVGSQETPWRSFHLKSTNVEKDS